MKTHVQPVKLHTPKLLTINASVLLVTLSILMEIVNHVLMVVISVLLDLSVRDVLVLYFYKEATVNPLVTMVSLLLVQSVNHVQQAVRDVLKISYVTIVLMATTATKVTVTLSVLLEPLEIVQAAIGSVNLATLPAKHASIILLTAQAVSMEWDISKLQQLLSHVCFPVSMVLSLKEEFARSVTSAVLLVSDLQPIVFLVLMVKCYSRVAVGLTVPQSHFKELVKTLPALKSVPTDSINDQLLVVLLVLLSALLAKEDQQTALPAFMAQSQSTELAQ